MNRYQTFRLLIHTCLLIGLLLTACSAPLPVPTATLPAATALPTTTPLPTASPALAPTATQAPPTATPISLTATPAPTATPGPGDVILEANFSELGDWSQFGFNFRTDKETSNYTIETRDQKLYIEVPERNTSVYALYEAGIGQPNVQIDVDVETVAGPNDNNISVICRSNDKGWYELSLHSGGLWFIYKYEYANGFTQLTKGGSTAINMQKAKNHMTVVCQGERLALYINDVEIGSAKDTQFIKGSIGVSVSTFNISGAGVEFENLKIAVPDPANPPGGAIAPTLTPSATWWWAGNNYDGRWRGTTSQGEKLEFTVADGSISWFQVGYDLPDCSLNGSESFGPGPVNGDEIFLITADVFFSGAFTSSNSASGTLTIHPEACPEQTLTVSWSASK
ncbi:MAG: hypothetical protein AAB217_09570 [Chloroflexota bacterium]